MRHKTLMGIFCAFLAVVFAFSVQAAKINESVTFEIQQDSLSLESDDGNVSPGDTLEPGGKIYIDLGDNFSSLDSFTLTNQKSGDTVTSTSSEGGNVYSADVPESWGELDKYSVDVSAENTSGNLTTSKTYRTDKDQQGAFNPQEQKFWQDNETKSGVYIHVDSFN